MKVKEMEDGEDSDKTVLLEDYHRQPEKIAMKRRRLSEKYKDATNRKNDDNTTPNVYVPEDAPVIDAGIVGKQWVMRRFFASNEEGQVFDGSYNNDQENQYTKSSACREFQIKRELLDEEPGNDVKDNDGMIKYTDENIIIIEDSSDEEHFVEIEHQLGQNVDSEMHDLELTANDTPPPIINVNTPEIRIKVLNPNVINAQIAAENCSVVNNSKHDKELFEIKRVDNDKEIQLNKTLSVVKNNYFNKSGPENIINYSKTNNADGIKRKMDNVRSISNTDSVENLIEEVKLLCMPHTSINSTVYVATSNENVSSGSKSKTGDEKVGNNISESTNKIREEVVNAREVNINNVNIAENVARSSTVVRVKLLSHENNKSEDGNRNEESNRPLNINVGETRGHVKRLSDQDNLPTNCKRMRSDNEELTENTLYHDDKVVTNTDLIDTNTIDLGRIKHRKNDDNADIFFNKRDEMETSNKQNLNEFVKDNKSDGGNLENQDKDLNIFKFLIRFCVLMKEHLSENLSHDVEKKNAFRKSASLLTDEIQKLNTFVKAEVQFYCPVCSRISTYTGIDLYGYYNHDLGKYQIRLKKCYLCYGFHKMYNSMIKASLPIQSNKNYERKSFELNQDIHGQKGQQGTQKITPLKFNKVADNEPNKEKQSNEDNTHSKAEISVLELSSESDNDNNPKKGMSESINNKKHELENIKTPLPISVNKENYAQKKDNSHLIVSITRENDNPNVSTKNSVGGDKTSIETVHRRPVGVEISTSSTSRNNNGSEHIVDNVQSNASNIPPEKLGNVDKNLRVTEANTRKIKNSDKQSSGKYDDKLQPNKDLRHNIQVDKHKETSVSNVLDKRTKHDIENGSITTETNIKLVLCNERGSKEISATATVERPIVITANTNMSPTPKNNAEPKLPFDNAKANNSNYTMSEDRDSRRETPLPNVTEKIKKGDTNKLRPEQRSVSKQMNKNVIEKSTKNNVSKTSTNNNDALDHRVDNLMSGLNILSVTTEIDRKSKEIPIRVVERDSITRSPEISLTITPSNKDSSNDKLDNIKTNTPKVMLVDGNLSKELYALNMAEKSKNDGTNRVKTADRHVSKCALVTSTTKQSSKRDHDVNMFTTSNNKDISDPRADSNTNEVKCLNDDAKGKRKSKEISSRTVDENPNGRTPDVNLLSTSKHQDFSNRKSGNIKANTITAMSVERCQSKESRVPNISKKSKNDSSNQVRPGGELVSKDTSNKYVIKQPDQRVHDVKIAKTSNNTVISDHIIDNILLEGNIRAAKAQDKQLGEAVHGRRVSGKSINEDLYNIIKSCPTNQKPGASQINPTLSTDSSGVVADRHLIKDNTLFNVHPELNNDDMSLISKEANILTMRAGDKKGGVFVGPKDSLSSGGTNFVLSISSSDGKVSNHMGDSARNENKGENKEKSIKSAHPNDKNFKIHNALSKTSTITAESVMSLVPKCFNNDSNHDIGGVYVKTNITSTKALNRCIITDTPILNMPPNINKDQIGNAFAEIIHSTLNNDDLTHRADGISAKTLTVNPEASKNSIGASKSAELESKKSYHTVNIDTKATSIGITNTPNKHPISEIFIDNNTSTNIYYNNTHQRVDKVVTEAINVSQKKEISTIIKRKIANDETQTWPKCMKTDHGNFGANNERGKVLINRSNNNAVAMIDNSTVNDNVGSVHLFCGSNRIERHVDITTKKALDGSSNTKHNKRHDRSEEDNLSTMRKMLLSAENDHVINNPRVHSTAVSENNQTKINMSENGQNVKLTVKQTNDESNNENKNKAKDDQIPNQPVVSINIDQKSNERQGQENKISQETSKSINQLENDENHERVKISIKADGAKGVAVNSDDNNTNKTINPKENEANVRVLKALENLTNRLKISTTTIEAETETSVPEKSNKIIINSKQFYECPICSCIFQNTDSYLGHLKSEHDLINSGIPDTLELKNNSNHNDEPKLANELINSASKNSTPLSKGKYVYQCSICKIILYTDYSARIHRKDSHPELKYIKLYERIDRILVSEETGKLITDTNIARDKTNKLSILISDEYENETSGDDGDTDEKKDDQQKKDREKEAMGNEVDEDTNSKGNNSNEASISGDNEQGSSNRVKRGHKMSLRKQDDINKSIDESDASFDNEGSEDGSEKEVEGEAREGPNEVSDEEWSHDGKNIQPKYGYICKICKEIFQSGYACRMHRNNKHFQMKSRHLFGRILLSRGAYIKKREKNREESDVKSIPTGDFSLKDHHGIESNGEEDEDEKARVSHNEDSDEEPSKVEESPGYKIQNIQTNDDNVKKYEYICKICNEICNSSYACRIHKKKHRHLFSKILHSGDAYSEEQEEKGKCHNGEANQGKLIATSAVSSVSIDNQVNNTKGKDQAEAEDNEQMDKQINSDLDYQVKDCESDKTNGSELNINNRDSPDKLSKAPERRPSTLNNFHSLVKMLSSSTSHINQKSDEENKSSNKVKVNNQVIHTSIDTVDRQSLISTMSSNYPKKITSHEPIDENANVQQGSREKKEDKEKYGRTVPDDGTNNRKTGDEITQDGSDHVTQTKKLPTSKSAYIFTCLECGYATDIYDRAIRHCQNHFNDIKDTATQCTICQLNFDTDYFEPHQNLHKKHVRIKVVKYSYKSLFFDWDKIFDDIPLDTVKDFRNKSIYKTRAIKMAIAESGPWKYSLYQCGQCSTCVPWQEIEQHFQGNCYFVSYPCFICNRYFATLEMLGDHQENHSESYRIVAFNNIKDKNFNSKLLEARKKRQEIVDKEVFFYIYKCLCGLCFATSNSFKIHFMDCDFATKEGELCSKCTIPLKFESTELKNHDQLHHSETKCELWVYHVAVNLEKVTDVKRGDDGNNKPYS